MALHLINHQGEVNQIIGDNDLNFTLDKLGFKVEDDNSVLAEGSCLIRDLNKELGFDLCEDIVDLKYDTVLDKKLKAKLLVDQVEKICDLDPLILYEKTKNSREHNFKTFLNIVAKKPKYHEIFRQWCFKRHMPLRLSWS